ncbi:ABC-2 type transport system ATP-binding protein [Filimonas lacunae]|uniref:ABC-2 type transport system ATP-binding protein n=1 Tax=Filimonas lacunae TaxID=477680 RepID=A0A173MSE3_9BACT|nr:ATP-binding cassette domain-containing protein [Filimonas lacunae]BAV10361.1 ABC transporter, ATP-binding protein [Filimonas lacunae]SIT16672.1 ABC-2 type transport system ATP-binding protein [Filimonas lacunae]
MSSIVSISGISKNYGPIQALDQVSFDIPQSSVFGILGPNGSGKTTLLGILMNVLKSNAGSFTFKGQPFNAVMRKQIGTLLETPNFYHYLSAERNLRIAAEIKGRGFDDIDVVLKKVNLYERRQSKFSTFSLGMKQRLAIASSLLGNPEVLVLDEPTNGLDPVGIAEIRSLITQLAAEGKTIIMASHLLDEVEKVCTHVAILKKGKLLLSGNVNEVFAGEDIIEVSAADITALIAAANSLPGIGKIVTLPTSIQLLYPTGTANLAAINQHCFNNGVVLSQLQLKKKSLESNFFELTN